MIERSKNREYLLICRALARATDDARTVHKLQRQSIISIFCFCWRRGGFCVSVLESRSFLLTAAFTYHPSKRSESIWFISNSYARGSDLSLGFNQNPILSSSCELIIFQDGKEKNKGCAVFFQRSIWRNIENA